MKTKNYSLKAIRILIIFLFATTIVNSQINIPSPEKTLGFKVGADNKLATYEQSIAYFNLLDKTSDLLHMKYAGQTSNGKPWYYAVITSKKNYDNLDRYREITQQLAHPKNLTRSEAKKLAKEGKPIIHIDGGLHASEVAGTQVTISLAYKLLNEAQTEKGKRILDDVIILLWPTLNPDGQNIIANWYLPNVGTKYESSSVPWLYQKYVGHDNNRDSYMVNMHESRVVARTWRYWEPSIIHVHHQSSPFPTRIWLPPFAEPIASQTPPITAREVNMIGMAMAQELESEGKVGAVHMGKGFDAWYPGYIDYMSVLQNTPSFWTETAGNRYAIPKKYDPKKFPKKRRDLRIESLYSSPWKGGWWRISDAMNYMQTASIGVLNYASKYSEELLFNKYQAATNTINKYKKEPPYAYFIPQKQRDNVRPVELLKRLAFNGIKVYQLDKEIQYNTILYPKGTWVIPTDQEYGELARQLLDVQVYPDLREYPGGPPESPYDAAGWTLPFQFEVVVNPALEPISQEIRDSYVAVKGKTIDWNQKKDKDYNTIDFAPDFGFDTNEVAAGIKPLPGSIIGKGRSLIVNPKENNAFRVLAEAMKNGKKVRFSKENNTYTIRNVRKSQAKKWVEKYAINAELSRKSPKTKVRQRIGIYRPWTTSMDMGWTRWLLDHFGTTYSDIRNAEIIKGNLSEKYDVILIASEREKTIINGIKKGKNYEKYTGGIDSLGVKNLDQFIVKGGTLVCMNSSSEFAINSFNLPVINIVKGISRKDFFTGGSIMEVITNTKHPIMSGMPEKANVFVYGSPVFTTLEGFKGEALAKYQAKGSPLKSGYLLGETFLNNYAAALDVQHGKGHVILLGFRPQWRGQPMGTFRVLFNSLFYGNEISEKHSFTTDFWSAPMIKNNTQKK